MKKNNPAARAHNNVIPQQWIFHSLFYMKTIRAKQAKVHFACFVQRDQHGMKY